MGFVTSGTMSSNTDLWGTPQKLFDKLNEEFNFDLDVCADHTNHKCPNYFDKEIDGLSQNWVGYRCFMNPPYGRNIKKWTEKAVNTARGGGLVVGVLPCRTDTKWWSDVMKAAEIRFIKGRLSYNDGEQPAPFPSCVVIWGAFSTPRIKWVNQDMIEVC